MIVTVTTEHARPVTMPDGSLLEAGEVWKGPANKAQVASLEQLCTVKQVKGKRGTTKAQTADTDADQSA